MQQTVVDYCLLGCCATQHDPITLVSGRRSGQRLSRSLAQAREISYDCSTACEDGTKGVDRRLHTGSQTD